MLNGSFLRYSDGIKQHCEILQQRTQNNKDMKDRVHPLMLAAKTVEDGTDGIDDAAGHSSRKPGLVMACQVCRQKGITAQPMPM